MRDDSSSIDEPLNWAAALLGWILPGMGQFYLGHRRRGIYCTVGVLGLFLGGILIGGVDSVDRREDPLWFYAQAGAGPVAFAADWMNASLVKSGRVGELVESPAPPMSRTPVPKVSTLKSVTPVGEVGILYCALAGLMNVVVVLDALRRPRMEHSSSLGSAK